MRTAEWVTALLGTTVCLLGALASANGQVQASSLGASPLQALWPLPALTLIDWAALGLIGLVSVALGNICQAWIWKKVTWAVCGALVVLTVVGAFSIGPFVMIAVLCFGLAAALPWLREKPPLAADLLALAVGGLMNLVLLFVFILFGRL